MIIFSLLWRVRLKLLSLKMVMKRLFMSIKRIRSHWNILVNLL